MTKFNALDLCNIIGSPRVPYKPYPSIFLDHEYCSICEKEVEVNILDKYFECIICNNKFFYDEFKRSIQVINIKEKLYATRKTKKIKSK